jgi:hypothetical protein
MLGILFYISPHALLEVCGFYSYPLVDSSALQKKMENYFFCKQHIIM